MTKVLPLVAALIVFGAAPAAAHTITPGTSGFTDGLHHPFGLPAHMMMMLGVGLSLGQQDIARWRVPLYGFLAALLLGLATGPLLTAPSLDQPVRLALLSLAGVFGALIALARKLPRLVLAPLMAFAGFALGFDSAPDGSLQQTLAALVGTGFAVVVAILNLAMLAHYAHGNVRQAWQAIGLRVVGSWIAAAAIMVLALELRSL